MDDSPAIAPLGAPPTPAPAGLLPVGVPVPPWFNPATALVQVVLACALIPTQLVAALVVYLGFGVEMLDANNEISLQFVAMASLIDTAVVAILIRVFLALSGETSREVFVGPRRPAREIGLGLALVPVTFLGLSLLVLLIRTAMPWMHNVQTSPFESFMSTPLDAAIFLVVAVLAGGVREELQRGFLLHRFGQHLGGMPLGLAIYSLVFGIAHYDQGWDVALSVGVLGLIWGVTYMKRRSSILAMANHAGFNGLQVLWAATARSLGIQ